MATCVWKQRITEDFDLLLETNRLLTELARAVLGNIGPGSLRLVRTATTVVTRIDTPKYGETLKFMYIKYQPILVVLLKVYQV